jgi:hypothetical protein
MGEHTSMLLNALLVAVESEDFVAHLDQRRSECGSESSEPDDDDLAAVFDPGAKAVQHRVKNLVSQ